MILNGTKNKQQEAPYSFRERFLNIERIAIIYPQEEAWLRIARYTLQKLYNLPDRFEYLLFLPGDASRPVLNIKHQYATMRYQPRTSEQVEFQTQVATFNPQLLLQLEPSPGDRFEKAIAGLNVPLKMGFGSEQSCLNVVYSQRPSGFYEKNLLNLISLIKSEV